MRLFILAVLVSCACASPQYVKSRLSGGVKGGYSGPTYQGGENLVRYFNNTQPGYGAGGYNSGYNMTEALNYEKGVCYIEVPTASIARDPAHVPAGNGSRSDLSRIRSCCEGYIRNIHNYRICDPVCTNECVNALCTEPETCTCFPGHVMNLGGICVSTCPIGCQNGHCSGGECICKSGYRLDSESRFCVPVCRDNCGRMGNCTAPDTCDCKTGYSSTPEGACRPHCDNCGRYAECVAPNDCRCQHGYTKNTQGDCVPQCADNCQPNGQCVAPNVCNYPTTSTTSTISPAGQNPYGGHDHNQNNQSYYHSYPSQRPRYPINTVHQYPVPNHSYPSPYNHSGHHQYNINTDQRPPTYSDSQHGYYDSQRTNQTESQQVNTSQSSYNDNQYYYSGGQYYPSGNQQNSSGQQQPYPGQQQPYPGQQQPYPGQHQPYPGQQQPYPGQPQPYPGQQQPYPGQQQPYPGQQQPNPGQQQPNPGQQQTYPGYQPTYPGYQRPNSDNQHHYPHYPSQQQGNSPYANQSYPSQQQNYDQHSQSHYSENQMSNIETLCSRPCINGECLGEGRCVCNTGYDLDVSDSTVDRCTPHCPGGCPNGVCSSPNFCICNMGYYKERGVKGRANCVKRIRRSVADILVFQIPNEEREH